MKSKYSISPVNLQAVCLKDSVQISISAQTENNINNCFDTFSFEICHCIALGQRKETPILRARANSKYLKLNFP